MDTNIFFFKKKRGMWKSWVVLASIGSTKKVFFLYDIFPTSTFFAVVLLTLTV